jgi:hypothetical protein
LVLFFDQTEGHVFFKFVKKDYWGMLKIWQLTGDKR